MNVRPPTRLRASITITDLPAAATRRAAVSPARPAPTTITSARRFRGFGLCFFASATPPPASAPATAPAVPVWINRRLVYPDSDKEREA